MPASREPQDRVVVARVPRRARSAVPALAIVVIAGFLLGGCGDGGGSGVSGPPDVTAERPIVTATLPDRTEGVPAESEPAPEATEPIRSEPAETTEETAANAADAAEEPSSDSGTPWGWIILALAVLGGGVAAIVFWRRKRAATASWSTELADLSQNCLVTLDAVVAEGSVVTGRVQALAAEARALETRAADEASRREAGQLRAGLDGLVDSLEADRRLRFASPPPSPDQLAYSTDLIRQQITQLQGILRPRDPAQPPYGTTLYG